MRPALNAVAIFFIFVSTLSFAKDDHLSRVERESCLQFPMMIDLEKQVSGVHYSVEKDDFVNCDTDMSGKPTYENCSSFVRATFKYRYQEVTTVDYFTPNGKLVTTRIEKTSIGLDDSSSAETRGEWDHLKLDYNYFPKNEEAKEQLKALFAESKISMAKEIAKLIFESSTSVCSDSFYR